MSSALPVVHRDAVRLLVVDGDGRALLQHCITPDTREEFWCTPGGAIDASETADAAAEREPAFTPNPGGLSEFERRSILEQRWLGAAEVCAIDPAQLNPPQLPALLARIGAGAAAAASARVVDATAPL